MSEYEADTSRWLHGSDSKSDRFNNGRRNRIDDSEESRRVQAFNGSKLSDDSLPISKEKEDKYYQYLLRKSSSKRKSTSDESRQSLGVTNGNVSNSERSSFGRANNFPDRSSYLVNSDDEKQTNHETSSYRGDVYSNKRGQDFNHERKSSPAAPAAVDEETQISYDAENIVDRRPRVKDLRSLFDSGTSGKDEGRADVRGKEGNVVKEISNNRRYTYGYGNVDQATSKVSFNNKDLVKTNKSESSELLANEKGHVDGRKSISANNAGVRPSTRTEELLPMERMRVSSDPGMKWSRGGRGSLPGSTDINSSKDLALKAPLKLSKEEAKGAWRLSLKGGRRRTDQNTSDEDSDSSQDSTGEEATQAVDESRQQVSDKHVIKMLQKKHPTEELKKMFDGPEAFQATTKRQSFYDYDQDTMFGRDEGRSPSPNEMGLNANRSDKVNENNLATSENGLNKLDKGMYVDPGLMDSDNEIKKGDIDVSRFVADPTPPKAFERNLIRQEEAPMQENAMDESSDGQASSYKSMYKQFLKKEGVEHAGTPSPPKPTHKYTKETYRKQLTSEESEAESETLGDAKVPDVTESFAANNGNVELEDAKPEPLQRLSSTDSSNVGADVYDDLMPKEYDDETQDEEQVHDSSSAYEESDAGSLASPESKSDFKFNFVLTHQDDLKRTVEPSGAKEVEEKLRVKFSDAPHEVEETYHPLDYERGNDDIDPVSSSAEWELEKRVEKMDVFSVDLDKGGKSYQH